MKFIQIAVAPWQDTFSVLALSDRGNVYRLQKAGWVAMPMNIAKQNPSEDRQSESDRPEKPEDF